MVDAWFAERTMGAPEVLRSRVEEFFAFAHGATRVERLADAGANALQRTIAGGAGRPAALDLLAADALITLALLAASEADPAALAGLARALRLELPVPL